MNTTALIEPDFVAEGGMSLNFSTIKPVPVCSSAEYSPDSKSIFSKSSCVKSDDISASLNAFKNRALFFSTAVCASSTIEKPAYTFGPFNNGTDTAEKIQVADNAAARIFFIIISRFL